MESYGGYGPGNYGENIWDISSWTTDINWKDAHLRHHFDGLSFLDCVREIIDLTETYFTSIYEVYTEEEEEGVEYDFPYLDIIVLMTEEYLYGHFFSVITPLQELTLLEILCSYFQNNMLDPVRYFVFDCLFGLPNETTELQRGLMEHKTTLMGKLTSIAIGTKCGNILNCVAVWFHTYGSQNKRAAKVAYAVVNDYFFVCPNASKAVYELISVAPVFAYQFLLALYGYYKELTVFNSMDEMIPPPDLVSMISDWIIEMPHFCIVKIPQLFLQLPSIHNFRFSRQDNVFKLCPLLVISTWCILEPFVRNTQFPSKLSQNSDSSKVFSKLLYGFLNYISMQKKIELNIGDNPDDLEPGELLDEETESIDLMNKEDIAYLVHTLRLYLDEYSKVDLQYKEESVNRVVQIIQLAKWSGCVSIKRKDLSSLFIDIPQTKLLKMMFNPSK